MNLVKEHFKDIHLLMNTISRGYFRTHKALFCLVPFGHHSQFSSWLMENTKTHAEELHFAQVTKHSSCVLLKQNTASRFTQRKNYNIQVLLRCPGFKYTGISHILESCVSFKLLRKADYVVN